MYPWSACKRRPTIHGVWWAGARKLAGPTLRPVAFRSEKVAFLPQSERRQWKYGAGQGSRSFLPERTRAGEPHQPLPAEGTYRGRPLARRLATRKASIMLLVWARPVQAMSKAVPWATLVRMIGRPSVTLTAWCIPSSFKAICP